MVELLIATVHWIGARAERRVTNELINAFRRVTGKETAAFCVSGAAGSLCRQAGPYGRGVSRLVVVLPLQPLDDGCGFTLREWPLHLTVAPTFTIATDVASLIATIAPIFIDRPAIGVRAGRDEGFGRRMNRAATVVDTSDELRALHGALCTALVRSGAHFDNPDFTGPGFRPHVTKTRRAALRAGEELELRQAAMVDMAPHGDRRLRRVLWTAALGLTLPGVRPR